MNDSSDEELSNEWIPYSERSEWKDVEPLEQDDGENPVVVIAYSEKCKNFKMFENIVNSIQLNHINFIIL